MSSPAPRGSPGVTYTSAAEGYFAKRRLTRSAGIWSLWGMGVAAVVSGDFSGWNFGIAGTGWAGFVTGRAETIEYIATDRVIAVCGLPRVASGAPWAHVARQATGGETPPNIPTVGLSLVSVRNQRYRLSEGRDGYGGRELARGAVDPDLGDQWS
jgi:hypothetical protein